MMRFRIIIFVLAVLISGTLTAQYFNKTYNIKKGGEGLKILPLKGQYIISVASGDGLGNESASYLVLDSSGNKTGIKEYKLGRAKARNSTFIHLRSGNLADFRTFEFRDSNTTLINQPWLIMLNIHGDTLWTKKYTDTAINIFRANTFIETPDSGFLLVNQMELGFQSIGIKIIRTDKDGAELWHKTIPANKKDNLTDIVKHPNGNYYLSGGSGENPKFKAWLIGINDTGKVVFNKKYNTNGNTLASNVLVLRDSNLIIGLDTAFGSFGSDYSKKQALKIEPGNGDVIWNKQYDSITEFAGFTKIIEGKKKGLYALGGGTRKDSWPIYSLIHLTANGDTVWMHEYIHSYVSDLSQLWDFIRTEDGGFIFCGTTSPLHTYDIWVLKVDSNGCMTPECKSRVYDIRLGIDRTKAFDVRIKVFPIQSLTNCMLILLNSKILPGATSLLTKKDVY
ncbi:MAG: hypothetical protein CL840_12495 [Crocinitomicaceae bacterium]|nr:hypothetical protein [Crocinitomicaceae bacterium]|tara:strand:- start:5145 stop:6497 length:1353 start_codon:yes stop_codon:yes gene_type:complete